MPLEVGMLALAVVALLASGQLIVGAVFAALVIVIVVLLTIFRQWDA